MSTQATFRHQADVRVARVRASYPCAMANGSWLVKTPFLGISTDHKPGPRQPLIS
jgi:hypothetical protein